MHVMGSLITQMNSFILWIKICLNDRAQRAVISRVESSWRPVVIGVLQSGPSLIQLISGLDEGLGCTFSEFADDRNLEGVSDTTEDATAIQQDLDRLEN